LRDGIQEQEWENTIPRFPAAVVRPKLVQSPFSPAFAARAVLIVYSNYDHNSRSLKPVFSGTWESGDVLSELKVGETGVLVALDLPESVQNHLMHMGFVPNALVTVLRRAPAGDPTVYGIDGMEIALRRETAAAIQVLTSAEKASESAKAEGLALIEAAL
jgi:Fe2+ transport system protein FeoA